MPKGKPQSSTDRPSHSGPERRRAPRAPLPNLADEKRGRPPGELFDVLWLLHLEALRAGQVEVAYHVLAAALHCAELMASVALMAHVESTAGLHQETIDARDPRDAYSTAAAQDRGTTPLFTSLQATARAMAGRTRVDRVVEAHRRRPEAPGK
jgi:hypothetical protein